METGKMIKDAYVSGKLSIGTRSVMKGLKSGKMTHVIFASNCPENYKNDVNMHAKGKTEVLEFNGDSSRLGETCGKPFMVLMVGIKKG